MDKDLNSQTPFSYDYTKKEAEINGSHDHIISDFIGFHRRFRLNFFISKCPLGQIYHRNYF